MRHGSAGTGGPDRTRPGEDADSRAEAGHDSHSILGAELNRGMRSMQERSYDKAAQYFHSAAWTAARAGFSEEEVEAQLRLADAQLHARHFEAALASYRSALSLIDARAQDSSMYWAIRVSLAQALRRTGRLAEARIETESVLLRLRQGPMRDRRKDPVLMGRIARNVKAQLEAGEGNYRTAAELALGLAAEFEAAGDALRAGQEYANAALWRLLSAAPGPAGAGGDWRDGLAGAARSREQALARLRAHSISAADDKVLGVELLGILEQLFAVKWLDGEAGADGVEAGQRIVAATAALDRLMRFSGPVAAASSRFQLLMFRYRIAERAGNGAGAESEADLRAFAAAHQPFLPEWLAQDVGSRFTWRRDVLILAPHDPELGALLGLESGR